MIRFFSCLLLAAILMGFIPAAAQSEANAELIRLHVPANSDSDEDQRVKMCVTQAVREAAREIVTGAEDADQAFLSLNERLSDIQSAAEAEARRQGFDGPVSAVAGRFDFPGRTYGTLFVPAGEYRAVRVLLGEGKGANWWCVIYPDLCAVDEAAGKAMEAGEVRFYSSVARWLRGFFTQEEAA